MAHIDFVKVETYVGNHVSIYRYLGLLPCCRVCPVWRVILSSSVVLAVSTSSSCSSPATTTTASLACGAGAAW